MSEGLRQEIEADLFRKFTRLSRLSYITAVFSVAFAILSPGILIDFILWGPMFLISAYHSGMTLGVRLGLTPMVAFGLAILGFVLDFLVMPTGLWIALLRATGVFVAFSLVGSWGWLRMCRKIQEASLMAVEELANKFIEETESDSV